MPQKTLILSLVLSIFWYLSILQGQESPISKEKDSLTLLLKQNDNKDVEIDLLIELSMLMVNDFDHIKAKEYADEAYAKAHGRNDQANMGKALIQIAYVYWFLEDFKTSLEFDLKALEINEIHADSSTLAYNYKRLTHDYCDLFDYDTALIYIQKAFNVHKAIDAKKDIILDEALMGYINMHQGDYVEAEKRMLNVLANATVMEDSTTMAGMNDDLAFLLELQGKLNEALVYAIEGVKISTKCNIPRHMREGYIILEKIYVGLGKFDKAYETRLKKDELEFELMKSETLIKFTELNKEKEILVLEQQNQISDQEKELLASRSKIYKIGAVALSSILLILAFFLRQLDKNKKLIEQKNTSLQKLNNTKDKFFGIIGHDLRSPITALDSVSQQIKYYTDLGNKSKLHNLAEGVRQTTDRLSTLLDNLLQWSFIQSDRVPYHPTQISINEIVRENILLYEDVAAAKEINLCDEINGEYFAFADKQAIMTVVRNLVNNAIKFTEPGGKVFISSYSDQKTVLEIRDTGVGMNAKRIQQLFSLKKTGTIGTAGEQSTGLGLIICRDLIESNKGRIEVTSKLGEGSSFKIHLPKSE